MTVEIAVTLGGATLRHTAKAVSRRAVEGSARSAYRRAHNLVGKGGEVHHINPNQRASQWKQGTISFAL